MTIHSTIDTFLSEDTRSFFAKPMRMLIGGDWLNAQTGDTFATHDRATGALIADVACAGEADVDRAVQAAQEALSGDWSRMAPAEREVILRRLLEPVAGIPGRCEAGAGCGPASSGAASDKSESIRVEVI